jgi:hypothetical protein
MDVLFIKGVKSKDKRNAELLGVMCA